MKIRIVFLWLAILMVLFSCRREDQFIEDSSAKLTFSTDSILFDTVFTTIGSTTELFLVYNPHKERIKISSIRLNGGTSSNFRINVDGQPGNNFTDVEIAPEDSMFVFLEVTVDPNNDLNPFVIDDYIEFVTNGNSQRVSLVAWGQNAIYYTPTSFNTNLPDFTCLTGPCSDAIPPVDVTWTNDLPIVVYGYIAIDTLDRLTIDPGTEIYFHNNGGMWVYRGGTLRVNGTKDEPVLFRGDRLQAQFDDVPGQWDRIWINEGGINTIDHAIIENAFIGIQAEALFLNGNPTQLGNLTLRNTEIRNCSNTGLLSAFFNVNGENLLISNCGQTNLTLQALGNWQFDHCSFPNYFRNGGRETPSVLIQNSYRTPLGFTTDTPIVRFRNSIVDGNQENEFFIDIVNNGSANVSVFDAILKTDQNISDTNRYKRIIRNPNGSIFKDIFAGDFELIENSPAIDAGNIAVGALIPTDLRGNRRVDDTAPDLGAVEFVP